MIYVVFFLLIKIGIGTVYFMISLYFMALLCLWLGQKIQKIASWPMTTYLKFLKGQEVIARTNQDLAKILGMTCVHSENCHWRHLGGFHISGFPGS